MVERTLAIIKPDAVKKRVIGDIIQRYEGAGLTLIAMKMMRMSKSVAEGFYAVHRERSFFHDLTTSMSSGPSVVLTWRANARSKRTGSSWVRLILRRLNREPFELRMEPRLRPMPFMGRILPIRPTSRYAISFRT